MGQVIQLRKKAVNGAPRISKSSAKTSGLIEMRMTDEGSFFSVQGVYAERLQFAGYTLVKALNEITDRISASGTAGFTPSGPIHLDLNKPCRQDGQIYPWPKSDEGFKK